MSQEEVLACLRRQLQAEGKILAVAERELRAEVEAKNKQIKELQDLIDKPPEEADWVADYHLLQSALDGPIIDAARKWHAAYRKAQNSNLMRAKEVERLRAALAHELDLRNRHIESLEARIKELEAHEQQTHEILGKILGNDDSLETVARRAITKIERLEAAFLEARHDWACSKFDDIRTRDECDQHAREALERIKEGQKG